MGLFKPLFRPISDAVAKVWVRGILAVSTCQGPKKLPNMAIPLPCQATGSLYAATELPKMAMALPYSPSDGHGWQFHRTLTSAYSQSGKGVPLELQAQGVYFPGSAEI